MVSLLNSNVTESEGVRRQASVVGRVGRARLAAWALLSLVAAAGLAREVRVGRLTAPLVEGLDHLSEEGAFQELAVRVASQVRARNLSGPIEASWPRPMRTPTAALVQGGSCGDAALAMAAALDRMGRPFRILLINVKDYGATHVMVEIQRKDGRWLLADAIAGTLIRHPVTHAALTLDEVRALDAGSVLGLPPLYQPGAEWSLFGVNTRTNWESYGPPGQLLRSLLGARADSVSLRALWIEPGLEIAVFCILLMLLDVARVLRTRRPA